MAERALILGIRPTDIVRVSSKGQIEPIYSRISEALADIAELIGLEQILYECDGHVSIYHMQSTATL
jgi:hypothetical protein